MKMKLKATAGLCALLVGTYSIGFSSIASAETDNQDLKQQVDMLQKKVDMLSAQQNAPAAPGGHEYLERKAGKGITFLTHGGEISIYGDLDVSADYVTNGISGAPDNGIGNNGGAGTGPFGKTGYMPAISGNNTNIGMHGFQSIAGWDSTKLIWQVQANYAATVNSGTKLTNSNQSNAVSGTLASGTSYIGFSSKDWGSVKGGKGFAPYATSTNPLNPFGGKLGNMDVIMGNSGGDNRVEFGSPLEHNIMYNSPNYNGFSYAALFAPGMNRAFDSSAIPSGSSDCAGGNIPGSGGAVSPTGIFACDDGAFSNVFSANVVYDNKQDWYLTAAFESHQNVNRSSDIAPGTTNGGYTDLQLASMDTANETAAKVGAMYKFNSTGTSIGGIFESMKRNVPAVLSYQNERQRNGTWLVIEQKLPNNNQLNFGWAHAATAAGDPGQHNDGNIAGAPGQKPNNSANMFTLLFKHQVDADLSFYANIAETVNSAAAHYDLGAGGHGTTTDCHDSGGPISAGGYPNGGGPNCWAGTHLVGISIGTDYKF